MTSSAPLSAGIKPNRPPAGGAPLDEEQFARDMSLMLLSGLSLMDSLKTLRERASASTAGPLDALTKRLTQGEALSQAMLSSGAFRASLLACVKASELTGDLPDSLARYAANAGRLRALRSRMVSALVYPCVLLAVAALVVVFLLLFVVPRFALVLESAGKGDMPAMSQVLISVGRALHNVPNTAWMALGCLSLWAIYELVKAARERRLQAVLAGLASRIPGIRDIVRAFGHSQFARSGAMLVRSGVPVLKALAMCRELLVGVDRPALDRALASATAGAPLAAALHEQSLVDTLGLRVLRVAEQTGQLETALERLADVHDQALERTLDRVGRLIEPILMLGIGLVVGGIVVLMYLPIFQLAASI
jgi:general secretion pathway protein F